LGLYDFNQHAVRREDEEAFQLERVLDRNRLHDLNACGLHPLKHGLNLEIGEGYVVDRPPLRRLDLFERRIAPPRRWRLAIGLAEDNELNVFAAKRIYPDGLQGLHVAVGFGNRQWPLRR